MKCYMGNPSLKYFSVINLFDKPESKKVIADLTKRLAAWGKKTGDKMTAQLIRQWQSG